MRVTYFIQHWMIYSMSLICLANHHRQHFQIYWNSSNPFFQKSGFLTVYLGDLIDFLCPHYDRFSLQQDENSVEYNNLYLVNEDDYHRCQTSNYQPLMICNRPFDEQRLVYTLSISKYLPYPNVPEFDIGQLYYFISTSSGTLTGVDQHSEGLCQRKHFKLIVHVEKLSQWKSNWQRPIVAKRTNLTFIDPNERLFLFSSSDQLICSIVLLITTLLINC